MRPLRLFTFWLISFSLAYGINILAVTAWMVFGYNNIFLVMAMVNVPLVTLLFSWCYFRPGFATTLSGRIKNATVWIALDFLGSMIILAITPQMIIWDAFTFEAFLAEAFNFFALLVAGYVSLKHLGHSKVASPPSLDLLHPGQE